MQKKDLISKLYNTIFHNTYLSRQKVIFNKCQIDNLALIDSDCIYILIGDGEVFLNSIYIMIEKVIKV